MEIFLWALPYKHSTFSNVSFGNLFFYLFFNWKIISLQHCVCFCFTMQTSHNYIRIFIYTCIYIHIYIYIPSILNFPPPTTHGNFLIVKISIVEKIGKVYFQALLKESKENALELNSIFESCFWKSISSRNRKKEMNLSIFLEINAHCFLLSFVPFLFSFFFYLRNCWHTVLC